MLSQHCKNKCFIAELHLYNKKLKKKLTYMKARITNIVIDVIAVQNQNKNSKPMDPDHQTFFCNVGTAVLCYIIVGH